MRNSVVFYKDWYEAFKELSDEERLEAYESIFRYAFDGEVTGNKLIRIATSTMRCAIDRDNEKYEQVSQRRKEAVAKRWNAFKSIQDNTNHTKDTNGTEKENEKENVKENEKEPTNVGDRDKEKPSNEGKKKVAQTDRRVFRRPSVEEVDAYCRERGNSVNAQSFVDFYESKGWVVGKSPMKDWKAAVRTWEQKEGRGRRKEISLGQGEWIDEQGKRRYGSGTYSVPMDAPPRPDLISYWSEETKSWVSGV
jgi:hypothetical protein